MAYNTPIDTSARRLESACLFIAAQKLLTLNHDA